MIDVNGSAVETSIKTKLPKTSRLRLSVRPGRLDGIETVALIN